MVATTIQSLRKMDLKIDVNDTQIPKEHGRQPSEKLPAREYNYILKLLEDNFNLIAHVLGDDLTNVNFPNKVVLKSIISAGSKRIITDNERTAITHTNRAVLNALTNSGSGEVITVAERRKISSITDIGSGSIITAAERQKIANIMSRYVHPANHPATMITFNAGTSGLVSNTVQAAIIEVLGKIVSAQAVGVIFKGIIDISTGLPDVTSIDKNVFYESMGSGTVSLNGIDTEVKSGDWLLYYGGENPKTWSLRVNPNRIETLVKTAQSRANSAYTLADGKEPKFTKNSGFNKNKSDSTSSTSSETLATSKAVKAAYDAGSSGINKANAAQSKADSAYSKAGTAQSKADSAYNKANAALPKSGGTMSGNLAGTSSHTISGFGKVYNAVWNDYAEFFKKSKHEKGEPGDLIELNIHDNEESYIVSTNDSSGLIVGVITDECAHLIGGDEVEKGKDYFVENCKKYFPVGLAGRVRPKVIGKISKGDYIVSSHMKGTGRKYIESVDNKLSIIGVALENKEVHEVERVRILIK